MICFVFVVDDCVFSCDRYEYHGFKVRGLSVAGSVNVQVKAVAASEIHAGHETMEVNVDIMKVGRHIGSCNCALMLVYVSSFLGRLLFACRFT